MGKRVIMITNKFSSYMEIVRERVGVIVMVCEREREDTLTHS